MAGIFANGVSFGSAAVAGAGVSPTALTDFFALAGASNGAGGAGGVTDSFEMAGGAVPPAPPSVVNRYNGVETSQCFQSGILCNDWHEVERILRAYFADIISFSQSKFTSLSQFLIEDGRYEAAKPALHAAQHDMRNPDQLLLRVLQNAGEKIGNRGEFDIRLDYKYFYNGMIFKLNGLPFLDAFIRIRKVEGDGDFYILNIIVTDGKKIEEALAERFGKVRKGIGSLDIHLNLASSPEQSKRFEIDFEPIARALAHALEIKDIPKAMKSWLFLSFGKQVPVTDDWWWPANIKIYQRDGVIVSLNFHNLVMPQRDVKKDDFNRPVAVDGSFIRGDKRYPESDIEIIWSLYIKNEADGLSPDKQRIVLDLADRIEAAMRGLK